MKVFVSGGCGQVGSHVAETLLARGDEVLALDDFSTGRRVHLPERHKGLRFVEGSIADKQLVDRLFAEFKPEAVVHTAVSYKDPDDWFNDCMVNAAGGAALIRASMAHKVSRFVYFQTALCYGTRPQEQPITLGHPILPGDSSYSISKTPTEWYLQLSGLDWVSFRLANVVGPRNVSGPLPIFYQRLKSGKRCFVTESRRDFVFVKDLAKVTVRAVDGTGSGAYHFSSGTDVAIIELYDAVVRALKLNEYPQPEIRPLAPDDVASILLDPSQTFADFGKIEFTPLDDTVAAAVEYYDKHGVVGGYTHLKQEEKKN
jgi:nucleoside-diphosphate-sugar epimerase